MKTLIAIASFSSFLASGCALVRHPSSAPARVPANPPDFRQTLEPNKGTIAAAERDALIQKIDLLREEVAQLQQLFRLQQVGLDGSGPGETAKPSHPKIAATATAPSPVQADRQAPSRNSGTHSDAPEGAPRSTMPADNHASYAALFTYASSQLDASARVALATLQPALKQASTILIRGFADPDGNADANKRLAASRAEATAHELVKLGVPAERIQLDSSVGGPPPEQRTRILGLFNAMHNPARRVEVSWDSKHAHGDLK